jgi:hypothetical protein
LLFSRAIFWLPPSTTTSSPRSRSSFPTQPRLALFTAALSLSAIPVMCALGRNISLHPVEFFFILIFRISWC